MSTDYTASRDERLMKMYSRTAKVLGGIQYTMNSSKTQVNKKLKSLDKRLNNINRRLTSNAPVAISTKNGNKGKDYYRTNGKERISNVSALNSSFHIVDVFINPANSDIFPWLSGIGSKYDLYRFKRLKFNYIPSLPTSEEGNVYLGVDYNTLDPLPADSTELCQLSHWTMNVVWKPTSLTVDLNSIGWLYTRSGPVANADYKTYDLGRMFLATEGIIYNGIAGYIEVEYDVEFKRRQPDYINRAIPTSDVYNPIGTYTTNSMAAGSTSSSFTTSYSNNSIITFNNEHGYFQVSKDVIVTFSSDYNGGTVGGGLKSSTDNDHYTIYDGASSNTSFVLLKGVYYKPYNTASQALVSRGVLIVVSNV